MNFATRALLELQETTLLAARAARGLFKRPRYIPEIITQMDLIGVGSLTIVVLTGFFTGGVLPQQIDAMRALGTDPIRKLVGPRLVALVVILPLLTVLADVVGIVGGGVVATGLYGLTMDQFLT